MSSLLRSTKFVRYFTGAARTLILNSAKTAEANLFNNPKALCAANNILIRDYATSKKAESLEPLLQKLDSEVKRFGRIAKKDIDEVFDELQSKSDISSSQSLLVIRCCGELVPEELPEQRTLLVQKIWNILTEKGIPMDISHYNALLRVYIENEHPFSPAQFLEELERKGLQPNRVTYNRIIWRYCQEGDVEGATNILEKMRELKHPVSEPVLNALVMGHAFQGDTEGAKAVIETMANAGLQPTNRTFTFLACGYAKQGDVKGVEDIIKLATEKDAYMTDKDILDVIEHLTLGGNGDKVEQFFHHLQKGFGYNQDVCNLILRLLNKGYEGVAKKVMSTMPKNLSVDTPFKGAFFVKQLLRIKKSPDDIIKSCKELEAENLVPNALYIATECALQLGNVELIQKLFVELQDAGHEIRNHYYWPLLVKKGIENDEEGLLQVLRDMANKGLQVNSETLRDYVLPYLIKKDTPQNVILKLQIVNIPVIHSARNVMIQLLDLGKINAAADIALQYRPRGQYSLLAHSLIKALNETKNIDAFVNILHVVSSKPSTLQAEQDTMNEDTHSDDNFDTNEVGRIIKSSVKVLAKPELCEKLLTALLSKGIRINTETAEAIENQLGESMTTNLSELLSQLTSTDLELSPVETSRRDISLPHSTTDLENLLTRAKEKGGNNVNRIQKQLLLAYIKENNIAKVNSFVEELKSSHFDLNLAILAQLYEFYCIHNEIDIANEYRAEINMKSPDFKFTRYKLILMANALVNAGKFDEAVEFLKENKHDNDEKTGFLLNSKCWQLLNNLAEQKDDTKVNEMTECLIENGYNEPSNIILGPSIKVHLLKDDIDGALKAFENCCKKYRCTPWKGELMKALIRQEDANKLQWLADLSTQIHGEVNILHDLVLAFVECGRIRQARRILETPGLQTRHRRLNDACQRYVEEGKATYLEGLLHATKRLNHIDRSNIFYHLLVTYCKADETDKALGVWTILQEDDEIPSDQFLKTLGEHLKSKNRPIPFVMPQETLVEANKNVNTQTIVNTKVNDALSKVELSKNIETLVHDGKLDEAMDLVIMSIKNGKMPKSNVLKFLLKNLANEGNVEKIEQLGHHISETVKRTVTYNDKLTLAMIKRGDSSQHVDNLLRSVGAARTEEDLKTALMNFPRSTALAAIMPHEENMAKCSQVAEIAASKGVFMPYNLIWMEYILAGNDTEAEKIWNKWLVNAPVIIFRRLLQESYTRNEPRLIHKLIDNLKTNKILNVASLGNAYSRLINYYLVENKLHEAQSVFEDALKDGVTTDKINKTTLIRLKSAVEAAGKEFTYNF